jgi:uncharacterized repeat protein (TIGR02543 family)
VLFQVSDGYIQWQYQGDSTWTNLVSLMTLTGADGLDGTNGIVGLDGREVLFQVAEGYIQWQYQGDTTWTNLVSLSTVTGADGLDGVDGKDGKSAYEIYLENYPDYIGSETEWLNDLINGKLGTLATYTVAFDSNGGSEVVSQDVDFGYKAVKPINPTREGYTFDGWYINGNELWVFGGYVITEDITLTAQWKANEYTVTLDAGLGTINPSSIAYTYDSTVNLPTPVLADNYFMGWYNGETLVESGIWTITSDVTLTAYWIQAEYNVYYELNYGSLTQDDIATYGENYTVLDILRTGYTFLGWYDDSDQKYEGGMWSLESDLNLTAKWKANTYKMTLDANGGTLTGSTTIDVTYDESYTLEIPTPSGDAPFRGWYYGDIQITNSEGVSLNNFIFDENIVIFANYYIEIYSINDLIDVSLSLNESYKLMNDIDITELEWIPFGDNKKPFTGVFDGNEKYINGLQITNESKYIGLFGYNKGIIKNLKLSNISITVTLTNTYAFASAFVGANAGTINNLVTISGKIRINNTTNVYSSLGAIVGHNSSEILINNVTNNISIESKGPVMTGGIIGGSSKDIHINEAYNYGSILGSSDYVGGIVGKIHTSQSSIINYKVSVSNSGNQADISGNSNYVGGLIGSIYNWSITPIRSSLSIDLINSYNHGKVTGTGDSVGGLVGQIKHHINASTTKEHSLIININSSYNTGSIEGASVLGGLLGTISSSFDTKSMEVNITSSYNKGDIATNNEGYYFANAGGLIGEINSYSKSTFIKSSISNSYNSGNIISNKASSGGIIGIINNMYLDLNDNYNAGNIIASNNSGGIIGYMNSGSELSINNVFNFGIVKALNDTNNIGGILGYNGGYIKSTNTYYTNDIISNDLLVEGIKIGTKQTNLSIFTSTFFTDTLLWDNTIWDLTNIDIPNGIYPTLINDSLEE